MNRRLALLALPLAAAVVACGPPVEGKVQKPVPPCEETVTVIHEADPLPCIPGDGQRLDVLITVGGSIATATAKCNGMGGAPQGPASDQTVELVCRDVTT